MPAVLVPQLPPVCAVVEDAEPEPELNIIWGDDVIYRQHPPIDLGPQTPPKKPSFLSRAARRLGLRKLDAWLNNRSCPCAHPNPDLGCRCASIEHDDWPPAPPSPLTSLLTMAFRLPSSSSSLSSYREPQRQVPTVNDGYAGPLLRAEAFRAQSTTTADGRSKPIAIPKPVVIPNNGRYRTNGRPTYEIPEWFMPGGSAVPDHPCKYEPGMVTITEEGKMVITNETQRYRVAPLQPRGYQGWDRWDGRMLPPIN